MRGLRERVLLPSTHLLRTYAAYAENACALAKMLFYWPTPAWSKMSSPENKNPRNVKQMETTEGRERRCRPGPSASCANQCQVVSNIYGPATCSSSGASSRCTAWFRARA